MFLIQMKKYWNRITFLLTILVMIFILFGYVSDNFTEKFDKNYHAPDISIFLCISKGVFCDRTLSNEESINNLEE